MIDDQISVSIYMMDIGQAINVIAREFDLILRDRTFDMEHRLSNDA